MEPDADEMLAWHGGGQRRGGFHGITHRYVTQRAAEVLGGSVDTSLGPSPLESLLMGTRTGDIDPAAVLHVMREEGLGAAAWMSIAIARWRARRLILPRPGRVSACW